MNYDLNSTIQQTPGRKPSLKPAASKIYALRIASQPGIYHSWPLAKSLIEGCPGAKYKGFFSIQECMQFFWEQFPGCTFSVNQDGDYLMDNPEPVYQVSLIHDRLLKRLEQRKKRTREFSLIMTRARSIQRTNLPKISCHYFSQIQTLNLC